MKIQRLSIDTRSEEFKQWFGDWEQEDAFSSKNKNKIPSVAVGDNNKPQVMYHGTIKSFDNFEHKQTAYNSYQFGSWQTFRNAFFFTPEPSHANAFTFIENIKQDGGNIKPVYLNLRSPLDVRNGIDQITIDEFEEKGINPFWMKNFGWGHLDGDKGKDFVNAAKKIGYDGIIFNEINPVTGEKMETWAVFDVSQIRSIYK